MNTTVCTTYYRKPGALEPSLVQSCAELDIPLRTFGLKNPHVDFLSTKLIPLRDFLDSVKTSHVAFIDGNDTFFVRGLDALEEAYKRIASPTVVIGSERVCWPYEDLRGPLVGLAAQAGAPGSWWFLDTGLIMGPTERVWTMLDTVISSAPDLAKKRPDCSERILRDDVGLFAEAIVNGLIAPVIDYACEMICALRNTEEKDYTVENGQLTLTGIGSKPIIIHCNGHRSKDRRRLMWLYKALRGGVVRKVPKEGYRKT